MVVPHAAAKLVALCILNSGRTRGISFHLSCSPPDECMTQHRVAQVCRVLSAVSSVNPLARVEIAKPIGSGSRNSISAATPTTPSTNGTLASPSPAAKRPVASIGNRKGEAAGANGVNGVNGVNGATVSKGANKEPLKSDGPTRDPLAAFRSLFGLSVVEARELCRRAEAEGGRDAGAVALKKELDRRKAAYIRVVLTVAPALGMTHGNPGLHGEVKYVTFGFDVS